MGTRSERDAQWRDCYKWVQERILENTAIERWNLINEYYQDNERILYEEEEKEESSNGGAEIKSDELF